MDSLVLDAEALSAVARGRGPRVLAYLVAAEETGCEVVVPAAVLAELYRGRHHDQTIDSFLGRREAVRVVDTDRAIARSIGHLSAAAGMGSRHHVDATVAAVACREAPSVVLTADPDDLARLVGDNKAVAVVAI